MRLGVPHIRGLPLCFAGCTIIPIANPKGRDDYRASPIYRTLVKRMAGSLFTQEYSCLRTVQMPTTNGYLHHNEQVIYAQKLCSSWRLLCSNWETCNATGNEVCGENICFNHSLRLTFQSFSHLIQNIGFHILRPVHLTISTYSRQF